MGQINTMFATRDATQGTKLPSQDTTNTINPTDDDDKTKPFERSIYWDNITYSDTTPINQVNHYSYDVQINETASGDSYDIFHIVAIATSLENAIMALQKEIPNILVASKLDLYHITSNSFWTSETLAKFLSEDIRNNTKLDRSTKIYNNGQLNAFR